MKGTRGSSSMFAVVGTITIVTTSVTPGCEREKRDLHSSSAASARASGVSVGDLHPAGLPAAVKAFDSYQGNAYAMNEGKRLFASYNCTGCHAHGGGAIGPALMDEQWIYGSAPENIFATIVEGRPKGMPSFRGKIPDYQVAQLVAYVRSLAGLATTQLWAPGRDDQMNVKKPESRVNRQPELSEQAVTVP